VVLALLAARHPLFPSQPLFPPSFSRVKSQLKRLARALYSNPPVHGARIVAYVVGNDDIFTEWKEEMAGMAGRIQAVRATLVEELKKRDSKNRDWSFITSQIGMFSFTGLKPAQVIDLVLLVEAGGWWTLWYYVAPCLLSGRLRLCPLCR
jgi:hypothetical protein